ncbi:MAG TPA: hypothetical protein VGK54_12340 [Chloroflexota bacterium]
MVGKGARVGANGSVETGSGVGAGGGAAGAGARWEAVVVVIVTRGNPIVTKPRTTPSMV